MTKLFNETSADDFIPSDPAKLGGMEAFRPAPPPKTGLGTYRLLSPSAAVRVSPLCLGGMSLGNQWTGFQGGRSTNKEEAFALLDAYYDAGGNFVDTANNYQDGQSEHIIGEWMEARGNRDQIVLATKYTQQYVRRQGDNAPGIMINYGGNSKKSMKHSLEDSLRKLRTTYIDIFYVHWWDHSTSIPELMRALDDLVRSGKVLYLGISDTPAWVVAGANEYARAHGLAQFVVYQGQWSLAERDLERDIIPMCRAYGMGLAAWGVLGSGKFKRPDELRDVAKLRGQMAPTDAQLAAAAALSKVADEINLSNSKSGVRATLTAVAMAWARRKMAYCFPVVGGTAIEQLKANIEALEIELSPSQVKALDEAMKFNPGFPTAFFGTDPHYLPGGVPDAPYLPMGGATRFVVHP